MPVTHDQAQMLAALTVACRPHGAPVWDAPGVLAAIERVKDRQLAEVIRACTRAAEDRTAKTPAVISGPASVHWREKAAEPSTPRNVPVRERCNDCGQPEIARLHADDHPFTRLHEGRVPAPDNLRDIVAEAAHRGDL